MSPWWPLLGLLSWFPILKSSPCNSFEYWCPSTGAKSSNKLQRLDCITLMGQCKKDVTSLLTHWSYVFRALTHWLGARIVAPGNMMKWVAVISGLWSLDRHLEGGWRYLVSHWCHWGWERECLQSGIFTAHWKRGKVMAGSPPNSGATSM